MGIHQQSWHDDFEAGPAGRGGSGASSRDSDAGGAGGGSAGGGSAGGSGPSGFGRGWIPLERDIGIPGEDLPAAYPPAASSDFSPIYPGVAPAEAGAYPDSRRQTYAHLLGDSPDGPLPAQGRRGEDEAREGDGSANPYHFTPARRAQFLHHLAEDGNVRKACAAVGISSQAAYLARRRDRVFRSGWAAALVVARECVAQVLATRAIEGTREAVFYRGEVIGQRVRYDTRLLLAHLARLDAREDAVAEAHAERFDEILALVAGEDFPEDMADQPDGPYENGHVHEADPLLPMERWRHADSAGAAALAEARWGPGGTESSADDPDDEPEPALPCPLHRAETAARGAAHEEWDDWDDRVTAVNDALAAGALPEVRARVAPAEWGEGAGVPDLPAEPTAGRINPAAPAQAGAHPDSPQDTTPEDRAAPASPSTPRSPDAVTSDAVPAVEPAPRREVSWAPASAGATGDEGAAEVGAGSHPASRAQSKRAARRAKARLRTRAAERVQPAPEFSSCTVPTLSTSPEIRPAEPPQAPQPAPVEAPAPSEPPAPPRRVPRVITFDVDQFGRWR